MAGQCEGRIWRSVTRREVRRTVLAARKYDLAGRQPGRPNGPLGHVAIEVLELLGHVVDFRTGRLEPALAYLMRRLKRSKAAVVRALAALRAHGFLDWLRRFERVERDGPGPRIRQLSNAYRMSLPPRAARLVGNVAPLPDDMAHDIENRRQEVKAMKAALPLDDLAVVEVDDGPLGRALALMGRRIQESEFAGRSETMTTLYP